MNWLFVHVVYNIYHYNYGRMPNDQEMKLKNQRHLNSSLDKSLRPPVSLYWDRKRKKAAKSVHGSWESSCLSFLAPLSFKSWTQHHLQLTIYLFDLYLHDTKLAIYPSLTISIFEGVNSKYKNHWICILWTNNHCFCWSFRS